MSSNISADLVYQSPSFSMNFMNIIDEIPLVVNCYFPYVLFCALVKGVGYQVGNQKRDIGVWGC